MARPVAVIALTCAALYAAAGVGFFVLLASGSSAVQPDVTQRIEYIASHTTEWRIGWLVWSAAGVAVLLFYSRVAPLDVPGRTAVALAATGLAVRLAAESAMAMALPQQGQVQIGIEQWALVGSSLIGHGLETLAGVLIVWGAWADGRLPRWLVMTSLPLWLSGGVLCGAVLAGNGTAVFAATAALVVSATTWYASVGLTAWKAA